MKKLLLIFLTFASLSSIAHQDITCWDRDCMNSGWTRKDATTGSFTDYQCYREGCSSSGWIAGGSQNLSYYTQCKKGGCWNEGWYEIDRVTQMLRAEVICENSSCLTDGWTTYTSTRAYHTHCENLDCKSRGWSTQTPAGFSIAYCKNNSCFTNGWVESVQ